MLVVDCVISGNSAYYGGGISSAGSLTVMNSTFSGNSAEESGGGIFGAGTVTVTNSTFADNTFPDAPSGGGSGGGLFVLDATTTVANSTFSNNHGTNSGFGGGGIAAQRGSLWVANSTFVGNSAGNGVAGAILTADATTLVTNSTFFDNAGGVRELVTGSLTVTNSLFADNGSETCLGPVVDGGHNLVSGANCGFGGTSITNPAGGAGLDPTGLQDNGGPTETVALLSTSPAVNAGDNTACAATGDGQPNGLDQRGGTRPSSDGDPCDIGAYEYLVNPAPTLTGLSPETLIAGSRQSTLTLLGTGFSFSSSVSFGGATLKPSAVSATALTVTIPSTLLTTPRVVAVSVTNPTPGGGTTGTRDVAIVSAPVAKVTPTSLAFADQTVGTTGTVRNILVQNTGSGGLSVAGVELGGDNPGDFTVANNSCTSVLVPTAVCVIGVTFAPTDVGARAATLTIIDNAAGSPRVIPLAGTGLAPAPSPSPVASVAPVSLDFSTQTVGTTSAARQVVVKNAGGSALVFTSVVLTGDDAGEFTLAYNTCAESLLPGATCVVGIAFAPQSAGIKYADLTITDDAAGSPRSISLVGTGAAASPPPSPIASVAPASLDFGTQTVGTSSAAQQVMMKNTGGSALAIDSVGVTGTDAGSFGLSYNTCVGNLLPGASCVVGVAFAPQVAGAKSASLTISDDAAGSPREIGLGGTGAAASPPPSPVASIAPASEDFANQTVGTTSAARPVMLTNTGGSPLAISAVTLTGTDAGDFAITFTSCAGSLAPATACVVGVAFVPGSAGAKSAALEFADDATGSPHTVTLAGMGVAASPPPSPVASVAPASLALGSQTVGTSGTPQPVTLTNGGGSPLVLGAIGIEGTQAGDFVVAYNTCVGNLLPGTACIVGVAFAPTAAGARSASLSIADNAAGSPRAVALTGTGVAVPPSPTPAPAAASLAPTSAAFGSQTVGTSGTAKPVTLTNGGGSALSVGEIAVTGLDHADFTIVFTTCAGSLQPNAGCVVGVAFAPTDAGARTATLTFATDAAGSPHAVALAGTGVAVPPSPSPSPAVATVAPVSVAFGDQTVGATGAAKPVTLINTGGSVLQITAVTLGGWQADDFALAYNTCVGSLVPGAGCAVGIAFGPTAVGARSAVLTIADSTAGSPHTVALGGNGVTPPASPSPSPGGPYTVTASTSGPGTITPVGATTFAAGTQASFVATATGDAVFLGWTLDGTYVGLAPTLAFVVARDHTLVASFVVRPTFSDVSASDPNYQAITTLAALGIINPGGVNGSGQFLPEQGVKRAEMAAFIARLFGWQKEFHANSFPDQCDAQGQACLDAELWNTVAALADYGVVGGYTDPDTCASLGTTAPCYLPREAVLRVQVVSIVARAFTRTPELRASGFWERLPGAAGQYTNVPESGSQRSDLATYRANAGPIPGQASDTTFPEPGEAATRRFVIQALWQAYLAQFGTDRVP